MIHRLIVFIIMMVSFPLISSGEDAAWRAGVAKVNITPELPIWLSGYAVRNKPATEKLDDLWVKALVLEAGGERAVLVQMDVIGIDREQSQEICRQIEAKHKLPRASVALCTTHTHSGPVVGKNLEPMYSLDQRETDRIHKFTEQLTKKTVAVVGDALKTMADAKVSWGTGRATFGVNRRNNAEQSVPELRQQGKLAGPSDQDVPVLVVADAKGNMRAVVAGYACHGTVLDDYMVSGDWFGTARDEFERRHPEAMAMIWAGCGGDQNPVPRRSVEFLNQHGREFADSLDAVLKQPLTPLEPKIRVAYEEIDLPFAQLPTREELEAKMDEDSYEGRYARYLIKVEDRDGKLPKTYPYPIQAWRLGDKISWIFLGGEVVVDYALRLKTELDPKTTWVAAYSNDVMGYIASRRVLAEGGYEGGGSRIYYGLPALWDPAIEDQIIEAAERLAKGEAE